VLARHHDLGKGLLLVFLLLLLALLGGRGLALLLGCGGGRGTFGSE